MMFLWWTLTVVFLFVCLVMTLLVLIQKGRGGGLAGAFGGGGGNTAFGTKTGDVLTWATSIVFGLFVILAVSLDLVANKISSAPMTPAPITVPLNGNGSSGGAGSSGIPVPGAPSQTPSR
jgi:preprotein translocase subunit SecG